MLEKEINPKTPSLVAVRVAHLIEFLVVIVGHI